MSDTSPPDPGASPQPVKIISDKTPPSGWVSKWVREETFWREMVTRTLSALLAAFIIVMVGILSGWLSAPANWDVMVVVLGGLGILVASFFVVREAIIGRKDNNRDGE